MVLECRDLSGSYNIADIELHCMDPIRKTMGKFLKNLTVVGPGWKNFYDDPKTIKPEGLKVVDTGGGRWDDRTVIEHLNGYTFNLVLENCDAVGYVSEKIYDSFMADCIPLYLGNVDSNLPKIPEDMYIDLRKFDSVDSINKYIESLTYEEIEYIARKKSEIEDLAKKFQELRENEELCNYVITTCDGVEFKVHKSFIAVRSEYFYAMLNVRNAMVESTQDKVTLQNITADGLRPVLDYMYGVQGNNPINLGNVAAVLNAASMLQVTGIDNILEDCSICLLTELNETNYIAIRSLGKKFSLNTVTEQVDYTITDNGWLYNTLFSEDIGEFISEINQEDFFYLLKKANNKPLEKILESPNHQGQC